MVAVDITPSAQQYLKELLQKQENNDGMGIRMFVANPGTAKAETCIAYCRPGEEKEGDVSMELEGFNALFEERSLPFLKDAKVDYSADKMGGQLTIRAPNSKMPQVTDDSPLEDRISYILYNEVNPGLAAHGGEVSLVEITDDGYAILRFGGGCQGCSAVDMTLKNGVEVALMDKLPELKGIRDITDHTDRTQAYY
ncbi:Fe-S biogenesis protein NfuA [Gilvimarinus agarilyticus]|uniref:Fe-S biogenesis protein NfuA n=1 Tax=unclassified Gilvimarinus TaxID=2642066 RepID=UPI001C094793|nr:MULTISPECIES: Fe-S biogenesis protein NfuA [unclassified Gilvimarinus]MBU2887164.1 Fe-S biogenesis protein NfuA [Gilvimarinus agarilyticus]MDO6571823.1 Fe-S biogenesis protein NfuA [Gilvimarinus sp. 2_MG-2023]MDO6745896.1 Fe-S biogenesis protein NfuA [Gilvimarinus sp. 1_MG-2023]